MDEQLRQLERLFAADPSLENAAKLYLAYARTGQDFETIREAGTISEGLLEQLMVQELIPIDEDFFQDTETCENILSRAETLVEESANASAAQAWSNTEEENEIIIAYFGDAVAINGNLLRGGDGELIHLSEEEYQKQVEIPEDFRLTSGGGRVPCVEEEISAEHVASIIAEEMEVSQNIVDECLQKGDRSRGGHPPFLEKGRSELYTEVSGETEKYKRDPLFSIYQAKSITELQEIVEGMPYDEFIGEDSRSGIDWDRIPHWGEGTIRVDNLLRETNNWEGLLSWDTTVENPIFLHFVMSHDGKRTIETSLSRESES